MRGRVTTAKTNTNVHALAGFLDTISFDFFCTFTTRKPIGMNTVRRHATVVTDKIKNGTLFLGNYLEADYDMSIFWCAERFDVREGFHWHALLKANIDKYQLFDWYFRRYGRCQIIDNREPDRQLAASYYVSKYVTKELADYDIVLSAKHRGITEKHRKRQ